MKTLASVERIDSNFDVDLAKGKAAEEMVRTVFNGQTLLEVKRDLRWAETGNLFIELEAWSNREQKWVPSGANLDYGVFVVCLSLEDSVNITIAKPALHRVIKARGREIKNTQQPNPTRGVLIKPEDLLDAARGKI